MWFSSVVMYCCFFLHSLLCHFNHGGGIYRLNLERGKRINERLGRLTVNAVFENTYFTYFSGFEKHDFLRFVGNGVSKSRKKSLAKV